MGVNAMAFARKFAATSTKNQNGRRISPAPVFVSRAALAYSAAAGLVSAFGAAGAECLADTSTTSMQITVKIAEV
jgi:hypothetical protein